MAADTNSVIRQQDKINIEDEALLNADVLREKRDRIAHRADSIIAEALKKEERREYQTEDGTVFSSPLMSGEELAEHNRLLDEYEALNATLRRRESRDRADDIVDQRREFVDNSTDDVKRRQLEIDIAFHKKLMAAGTNEYRNSHYDSPIPEQGSSIDYELPVPTITKDPNTGANVVLPFEHKDAVGNSEDAIEASYRQAEILQSGKSGEYDLFGNVGVGGSDEANNPNPITVANIQMPTMVLRLYSYLIDMNDMMRFCTIEQIQSIGAKAVRDRRTSIPQAVKLAEGATYTKENSTFSPMYLPVYKWGRLSDTTLEATLSSTGFEIASRLVADLGIALSNAIGNDIVNGTGDGSDGASDSEGMIRGAELGKVTTSNAPWTRGNTAGAVGYQDVIDFLTSLSDAYFRMPNKRLAFNLDMVKNLYAILDGEDRPYFQLSDNMILGVPCTIDPSIPKYSLASSVYSGNNRFANTNYPILYGDFSCHSVRLSGGPRISYSTEYGFDTDKYTWKGTIFAGSATTAPPGLKTWAFRRAIA